MDNFLFKVVFAVCAKTHFQIQLRLGINRQAPCLILHFCAVVILHYSLLGNSSNGALITHLLIQH